MPEEPFVNRASPALRLMGLGWYFVLVIVGGIVGGLLLDSWLDTRPVFILAGLFGGLIMAFWGGYFLLMEAIGRGRGNRLEKRK
jgi:MFS family permease